VRHREATSLSQARRLKLLRYRTGKPCKNGHFSERQTSNGRCVKCQRESKQRWRREHIALALASEQRRRDRRRLYRAKYARDYRRKNRRKYKLYCELNRHHIKYVRYLRDERRAAMRLDPEERILPGYYPAFNSHNEVRCFRCATDTDRLSRQESGSRPGFGAFMQRCPTCGTTNYYDLTGDR